MDWTPLGVCGEVYKDAINDLIEDVTGLKPGDTNGWLAEYPKARGALYWKLTQGEHDEIERICDQWNLTGIPKDKKKKYTAVSSHAIIFIDLLEDSMTGLVYVRCANLRWTH